MKRTSRCKECGAEITKNGSMALENAMREHAITEHPKEFHAMVKHNREIRLKILELKKQLHHMWERIDE